MQSQPIQRAPSDSERSLARASAEARSAVHQAREQIQITWLEAGIRPPHQTRSRRPHRLEGEAPR